MLHEVDVQVGGGVEHGQQVGDLCHTVYKGWKIRIQLEWKKETSEFNVMVVDFTLSISACLSSHILGTHLTL